MSKILAGRVKMHTQKLDLENWVKIDRTYASQQREKERLLETKRDLVFVTNDDPSTVFAKQELLELLCDYLPSNACHFISTMVLRFVVRTLRRLDELSFNLFVYTFRIEI